MNKRGAAVLFVLSLLTAGFSLYQDTQLSSRIASEHTRALSAERDLATADIALASALSAQSVSVSDSTHAAAALTKSTEQLDAMEAALRHRRTLAVSPELAAKYDAALQSLAEFRNIDVRARAALGQGDRAQAAALVGNDGATAASTLAGLVQEVRTLERSVNAGATESASLWRSGISAAALLVVVAVCGFLARALSQVARRAPTSTAQMIKDLPPPVKSSAHTSLSISSAPTATPVAPMPVVSATPTPSPAPSTVSNLPIAPALRPATLAATADICVDLARLLDGRDVPGLLARASAVLDAKGIMIWSADTSADLLRPSLAHGYGEKVLRKLKPLAIGDENITSQTFRTMQPQTMDGAQGSDATAIAVPLISSGGCVGVMAAEIRNSRSQNDVIALARIIAAQFATIVGPSEDGLSKVAEA